MNMPTGSRKTAHERGQATRPDGLYQVTTPYLCAGFVMEGGRITKCAPILRKKLAYWITLAVRVG